MKSGQLSWGFFLITIGALFLLTKYDIIISDFSFVWDIWPLIFVFWGAMIIFKNALIRPLLSILVGIYLAIMTFGIITNIFSNFEISEDRYNKLYETYYENYDNSIKHAELNFQSGAGIFEIGGTTDKLIKGEGYGSWANYDFNTNKTDSTSYINFKIEKKHFNLINGKIRNHLKLFLNENPTWDLDLNFGAAKANFDLTNFKVRYIRLNTGAANINLRLGEKLDTTNVKIDMGAAKIRIYIPKTSGCKLEGDMVLMWRDLDGLIKKDSNYYETPNYDEAKKKINVTIHGGVSSLKIITY